MIYFVQQGDLPYVKVGYTNDIKARVTDLQCCSPLPLLVHGTVPGSITDETVAHRILMLAKYRNEWFHAEPALALLRALQGSANTSAALLRIAGEVTGAALSSADIKKAVARTLSTLVEQHGVTAVARVVGCDRKAIRGAMRGDSWLKLHSFANLLALDPKALDPILALVGRTSEEDDQNRGVIEDALHALNELLGKLVRAA